MPPASVCFFTGRQLLFYPHVHDFLKYAIDDFLIYLKSNITESEDLPGAAYSMVVIKIRGMKDHIYLKSVKNFDWKPEDVSNFRV